MKKILATILAALALAAGANAQSIQSSPSPNLPLSTTGPLKASRFYGPYSFGTPTSQAVAAANTLYAIPFFVPATSVAKTLLFDIGAGNASAWNAELCIYTDTGSWAPGSVLADSGTVSIGSGSVTGVQTGTLNGSTGITLAGPAWYWLAFNASSASESIFQTTSSNVTIYSQALFGDSVNSGIFNGVNNTGYSMSQTFGACPGTYSGAINRNAATPYIEVGF